MIFKVTLDRFYIVIRLSVYVDLDAAEVVVFQVKRITTIRSVERFVVDQCDNYPARNLSCKQPLVYIISHSRTNTVTLADDPSDGILCIPDFKCFCLLDKHSRRNVYFTHQQFTFMYLHSIPRLRSIRHQTKGGF